MGMKKKKLGKILCGMVGRKIFRYLCMFLRVAQSARRLEVALFVASILVLRTNSSRNDDHTY